jgi:hypothetical protein
MARKIIDVWPVLNVTPEQSGKCWTKDEALAAYREVNEALKHLQTPSRFRLNIGFKFEEDARCEHCNGTWTEDSHTYNGGCCEADERADPLASAPVEHRSDCAVHNEPAMPNGPCDCDVSDKQEA